MSDSLLWAAHRAAAASSASGVLLSPPAAEARAALYIAKRDPGNTSAAMARSCSGTSIDDDDVPRGSIPRTACGIVATSGDVT